MKTDTTSTTEGKPEVVKALRAPKPCERDLRVNYTDRELLEIGKKLAESNRELAAAEDEKKAVTSQLKARCDSVQGRIDEYSGQLTSGYHFTKVPCETRFDQPKRGMKQVVRLDTLEVVETAALTMAELQEKLPGIDEDNVVQFGTPVLVPDVLVPDLPSTNCNADQPLTPESWDDLDVEDITPAGFTPEETESAIRTIRDLLVSENEEMRTREEVQSEMGDFLAKTNSDYVGSFLGLIQAAGSKLPGTELVGQVAEEIAAARISNTGIDYKTETIRLYNEGKTPGEISQVLGISLPVIASYLKGLSAQGKKVRGRKTATNSGTVSLPSDEGSRDDMGADSKNNL